MHSRFVVSDRLSLMVTDRARVPAYFAVRETTSTAIDVVVSFSLVVAFVPPLPTRTALIVEAPPRKIFSKMETLLSSPESSPK